MENRFSKGGKRRFLAVTALVSLAVLFPQELSAFNPGTPAIEQSAAFKQFQRRPYSSLSVLIYLIDRYKESKVQIVYDGLYFDAAFAANIAKWFLKARYQGETPQQWILRWCDTGIGTGKPIWVKDAYGDFKMSKDILFDELNLLEAWRARSGPAAEPSKAA